MVFTFISSPLTVLSLHSGELTFLYVYDDDQLSTRCLPARSHHVLCVVDVCIFFSCAQHYAMKRDKIFIITRSLCRYFYGEIDFEDSVQERREERSPFNYFGAERQREATALLS
jgi:hypothetical protein